MGDGARRNKGVILYIDGFTLQEVVLLINILILKFDISPVIHVEEHKYYRIYINGKDLKNLDPFIRPFIIPEMLYKISGDVKR
jgi:hypothetical protein